MKRRFSVVLSVLILASMLFAACAPATATTAPVPAATDTSAAPATDATATTAPTATAAATAAVVEPTATAAAPTATTAPKSTRTGGWLDKITFSAIADAPSAVAQLQAGTIDMYPVTVGDPKVFETVKGDKNLTYANVYGSNDQLLFNVVACADAKTLNPFTDMKIREAMNWAIDRNYISQEISGGLANPKFTVLTGAYPDAARYAGLIGAVQTKYAYNMDKAKAVVNEEMPKLGAKLDAGKWTFQGAPVKIIGLIRTEDSRKQIGDYFGTQLEALGFTVDRQFKTRKEAAPIWQGKDLNACKFSYYTAGWINTQIVRDEGANFVQYNTGKIQGIPLFNEFKPSPELTKVEDALQTNAFTTMDERAKLYETAMTLSMQESWWGLWVIDTISFEPYSNKISGAADLGGGFASSQLFPYTARLVGKEGGELRIAQSGILVQAWNPINGSNWTDDSMVQRQTEDWATIANPYTGLQMPKLITKGELVAKKGLPIVKNADWDTVTTADTIAVPDDAWADWDAAKQVFVTAKERAAADKTFVQTANIKTTITYIPDLWKTKWHDGSTLSIGDFVMGMILTFDQGKKDSKIYDESAQATVDTFLTHFKGVKIVSTDPLVIETYDDTYQLDAENNFATNWYPEYLYGMGAWHNLTPAIQAEADKKMAFSLDKSGALKVDQTSFISGDTLKIQSDYLDKDATAGTLVYEPTMSKFVKADEAKARYANLQNFYKAHGHIWLGTGAYMVDKVFTTEKSISLVRFADYMFPSDQFAAGFATPQIATVSVDGPTQVKAGDAVTFNVTINSGDVPYPSKDLDKVSYSIFDAAGTAVASGEAKMSAEGQYTVDLPADASAKLTAGSAKLSVAVSSKVVSLPAFATYEFVVAK